MLQNRHVGLRYYCTMLLNASARFRPRRSWVNVPDAIFGLPSRASVCGIFDGWNLRLDAGRPDHQAEMIAPRRVRGCRRRHRCLVPANREGGSE
jgi:hypothetical protein